MTIEIEVTDRSGSTHRVSAETGLTLMEVLREHDLDVEAICGGSCACATCHVYIDPSWFPRLPPREEMEQELLSEQDNRRDTSRLSCQIEVHEELEGLALTVAPPEQ